MANIFEEIFHPSFGFLGNPYVRAITTLALALSGNPVPAILFSTASAYYGAQQAKRAAREAEEQAKASYNSALQDITITRVATNSPFRTVYGKDCVGSDIVAIFTSGDKDEYKWLVCVHAAHECEAIDDILINDKSLGTIDAGTGEAGVDSYYYRDTTASTSETHTGTTFDLVYIPIAGTLVVTQRYKHSLSAAWKTEKIPYSITDNHVTLAYTHGVISVCTYTYSQPTAYVKAFKHLGGASDTADSHLQADAKIGIALWPNTAVLRDFCYTVIRLNLNFADFQGGIPSVKVVMRGKKLWDWRDSSWSTYPASSNPALIIYDYLTSEACGVDVTELPIDDYTFAANLCEPIVGCTYIVAGVVATVTKTAHGLQTGDLREMIVLTGNATSGHYQITKIDADSFYYQISSVLTTSGTLTIGGLYTINGTVNADQDSPNVLEKMTQAIGGSLAATTWSLKAGVYIAPISLSLDQSDIVGGLSITAGRSDADIYNGVKGQYTGSETLYVATDYTPYQNINFVSIDDNRELWNNLDFPYTNQVQRVWNLCRIFNEDQRNAFTISATFSLKVWDVAIGDRVNFTSSFIGVSNKAFRVTDKKFNPEGTISLSIKEDAPSIWDFADAQSPEATPNTNLTNPFNIDPLRYLICTSGFDAVLVQTNSTLYTSVLVTWPIATSQSVIDHGVIEIYWRDVDDDVDAWKSKVVTGDSIYTYISPLADGHAYLVRARCVDSYLNIASDWAYIDGDPTHLVTALLVAPDTPANFKATIIGDGILLTWDADSDQIYNYEVREGGTGWSDGVPDGENIFSGSGQYGEKFLAKVKTSQLKLTPYMLASPKTSESIVYRIKAINTVGKYSDAQATFSLLIQYPGPVKYGSLVAQVVDNNVLLYWQPPTIIHQPIDTYEVRKGAVYATAEVVGLKSGLFTTVFETASGDYLYWLTPIDIGGNYGQEWSVAANVQQPQDYVLHFNYTSDFTGGSKANAVVDDGMLFLPFHDSTFQTHFTDHSWTTIQDQISAGFPLYAQPTPAAGSYEEIWYLGSQLLSSRITATINSVVVAGFPNMQVTISTAPNIDASPDIAGTWADYPVGTTIYAIEPFSWFKVRIDVLAYASPPSGLDLLKIVELSVRLDEKGKVSAGSVACGAADAYGGHDGTVVDITGLFADISSIQLTIAIDTSSPPVQAAYAIYDFVDVPNPTHFLVLLYDISGIRVSGNISWLVKGF